MMRSIIRMIKYSLQGLFRNFWLSVVTLFLLILTLLSVNLILGISVLSQALAGKLGEEITAQIFLNSGVTVAEQGALYGYLTTLPETKRVVLIDAEENLEAFKLRHADDEQILAGLGEVGENPFGPMIRVAAKDPLNFPLILEAVSGSPEFSSLIESTSLSDYAPIATRLGEITNRVTVGGWSISILFGLISLMIIFNSIRLGIYVRREEIGVMKLVGAKDWFIKGPFVVEGLILVTVAVVIVNLIGWGLWHYGLPSLERFVGDYHFIAGAITIPDLVFYLTAEYLIMAVCVALTIIWSMRKHLKI